MQVCKSGTEPFDRTVTTAKKHAPRHTFEHFNVAKS